MGIIFLIIFIIGIIGAIVWFYISNKKDNKPNQNNKPQEPDVPEVDPSTNIEPDINPHVPDDPIIPPVVDPSTNVEPDEPDEPINDSSSNTKPEEPVEIPYSPFNQKGFLKAIEDFSEIVKIEENGLVYEYLYKLFDEARAQFKGGHSINNLPSLLKIENFPYVYDYYGDGGDEDSAFLSLIGWLFALQLSELKPTKRQELFKLGYEYGGYDRYSDIYGYKFKYDPIVNRLVAAAIYASMRGLREELFFDNLLDDIQGEVYDETLEYIKESDSLLFGEEDFYVDLRKFMPTAPGPYAPGYKRRPDETYPNQEKTSDMNLLIDRKIHEFIVENYNLDNDELKDKVVQAIADKEGDLNHLFGEDREYKEYKFNAVFGQNTLGISISPDSEISKLCKLCQYISSYQRDILQSAKVDPKQYGRLRPGCSWEKECTPHSDTDGRWNALCNFEIEDNDGCPTGYYNRDGEWVYPNKVKSEKDFVKYYQKQLYANSYPSGHSAGIEGVGMVLMQLMPNKSDLILRQMNMFAVNRTVARYHWNSDTMNGRLLGSIAGALVNATKDFKEKFKKCKEEINKILK